MLPSKSLELRCGRMGVKELWGILSPIIKDKPLGELSGMKLAVDLSCWVCDSQSSMMHSNVSKPHLRNLFFRTACLIDLEVDLVYVMDGKAPEIKLSTMEKRNKERYGQSKGIVANKGNRSHFKAMLRECQELLDAMGVPWVQSPGEAEKTCALLNKERIVDGCVTEDSDAFLYGARTVYRCLATDPSSFSAQECSMDSIESFGLSQDKLVVLALLLGCDYHPGVKGVGKETALKLLKDWEHGSALTRFKAWGNLREDDLTPAIGKMPHCSHCKHPGSSKAHKSGCQLCRTQNACVQREPDYECACEWHLQMRSGKMTEALVRQKAVLEPGFPFMNVIEEFLHSKETLPKIQWKRPMPNLPALVSIMEKKLGWTREYAYEKAIPLVTRWIVRNREPLISISTTIKPLQVLKERVRKGVRCFEVEWDTKSIDACCETFTTLEPTLLFARAFPSLQPEPKKSKKRAIKNKQISAPKSQPDIPSSFTRIQSKRQATQIAPNKENRNVLPKFDVSTPKRTPNSSISHKFDKDLAEEFSFMEISATEGNDTVLISDSELSDIVESIISRKPTYDRVESPISEPQFIDESSTVCNFHLSLRFTPETSHSRPHIPFPVNSTPSRGYLHDIRNLSPPNSPDLETDMSFEWKTPVPLRERLKKRETLL